MSSHTRLKPAALPKTKQVRAGVVTPEQQKAYGKFEHESYRYNWRSRENLRKGKA